MSKKEKFALYLPPELKAELFSKIRGGLYGLLIGDALGVPYEFHRANEIPPYSEIEMTPPKGFLRAHRGVERRGNA